MAKAEFDPSKPFEPVVDNSSRPEFDPNKPFEPVQAQDNQQAQSSDPQTSALAAGITGIGKGATLGYLPQIEAATEPIVQGVLDKFLPKDPQGFNIQNAPSQTYTQRRDQQIAYQKQLADEHPYANVAGEVVGGIGAALAPGAIAGRLGAASAAASAPSTFGGRLLQAAKTGATIGAIRNPGDTEGEVSPLQPLDRLKNTATDAATGAVLQGGLEALGKGASAIKNASGDLASYAEEKALKAAGAMKRDFKLLDRAGKVSSTGRAVLDEKLLSMGDTVHDIADKAFDRQKEIGSNISEIYNKVDDIAKSNPHINSQESFHDILDNFEKDLVSKYKGKADGKKVISTMQDKIEALRENPENADIKQLLDYRRDIDQSAKKAGAWGPNQDTDVAKELKNLRNQVQDKMFSMAEDVDQATGSDFANSIKSENRRYSNIKPIADMSANKSAAESANQSFGLGEKTAGAIGAAAKGGPGAVLAMAGSKAARQYGNPIVALAADKASKVLSSNPLALGKFANVLSEAASTSPEKFTSTIELLLKRPEFKQAIDSIRGQDLNLSPSFSESDKAPINRSPSTTKFTRSNQ